MATYTQQDAAGGQPSAPRFFHRFNVTFLAVGAGEVYAAGGYLVGLQARVGAGRALAHVRALGFPTASGNWDGRTWHYNPDTDSLMAYSNAATPIEIADDTNVSATTVELTVESY